MAGNRNFDVQYGIDNLNRVTRADEGTFASGSISNRSRDEQWTLTQTGNWDRAKVDLNGDGDFTDAGETDDTRTHNVANEMLTRDTDTNGTANYTLTWPAPKFCARCYEGRLMVSVPRLGGGVFGSCAIEGMRPSARRALGGGVPSEWLPTFTSSVSSAADAAVVVAVSRAA